MQSSSETPTIRLGMKFESGKSLVAYVKEYALHTKKEVRVDAKSRGSKTRMIVCTEELCPFKVVAYKSSSASAGDMPWYISSCVLEHRDCLSAPRLSSQQLASLPALREAVARNPAVSRDFLIEQVQSVHGLNLERQRRTLYKAKSIVTKTLERDELHSYRLIPAYLKKLEEHNPGTVTRFDMGANGEFKRCMIVCGPSVRAQSGLQLILGVDGAHCKHKHYSGIQLDLLGRDGNMRNVRIATALVPSENEEDYVWFFSTCLAAGVNLSVPIMSDRSGGLIAAARVLSIDLHYCTLHLIRDIRSQFPCFDHHGQRIVWELQEAIEESKYNSGLVRLEVTSGKEVRAYLERLEPAKWTVHANLKQKKLYGLRTTNFVESENSAARAVGIRDKLPFQLLEEYVDYVRADFASKVDELKKWKDAHRKLTPKASEAFAKETEEFGAYKTEKISDDIFHVYRAGVMPPLKRRVVISRKECSCGYVCQHGIPCRHLVAALRFLKLSHTLIDYFDDVYKITTYDAAFGDKFFLPPLVHELEETDVVPSKPPASRSGPTRKNKVISNGEKHSTMTKTYRKRCSKCRGYGHVRSVCPSQFDTVDLGDDGDSYDLGELTGSAF